MKDRKSEKKLDRENLVFELYCTYIRSEIYENLIDNDSLFIRLRTTYLNSRKRKTNERKKNYIFFFVIRVKRKRRRKMKKKFIISIFFMKYHYLTKA